MVTPDPVPNSEVKLDMFGFVLSLMGRLGAVYFIFIDIAIGMKIAILVFSKNLILFSTPHFSWRFVNIDKKSD